MSNDLKIRKEKIAESTGRKRRGRIFALLAGAVVFCTSYALILPALTLTDPTFCGLEEHQHTDECFIDLADCNYSRYTCGDIQADIIAHTHNAYCFDENGKLVCTLPEVKLHQHDDGCYRDVYGYVCGMEEGQLDEYGNAHRHTDECMGVVGRELVCSEPEIILHTHTDECFDEHGVLICGMPEVKMHNHDDSCVRVFPYPVTEDGRVIICGMVEHTHTDDCYVEPEESAETDDVEPAEAEEIFISEDAEEAEAADATEAEDAEAAEAEEETDEPAQEQETFVLSAQTANYIVSVTYTAEANIPEEAELRVDEITRESDPELYAQREAEYREAVGDESAVLEFLLNIGFYVGDEEIEPAAPVNVDIQPINGETLPDSLIHFSENGNEFISGNQPGSEGVSFDVDSFSDFGFFELPEFIITDGLIFPDITVGGGSSASRSYTILQGTSLTLTGTEGYGNHSWRANNRNVSLSGTSSNSYTATITANSEGTTEITHTYKSNKNNNNTKDEKITITVVKNVYTVEAGSTVSVQGTMGYNHSWSTSAASIATVQGSSSSSSATATGVAKGDVTLTHTFYTRGNTTNNQYKVTETITLHVTRKPISVSVDYRESVEITGAEGTGHTWTWTGADGGALSTSYEAGSNSKVTVSPYEHTVAPGTYTLKHDFTDPSGQPDTENVLVTVTAPTVGSYGIPVGVTATIKSSVASGSNNSWALQNSSYATVNADGSGIVKVTGRSIGDTVLVHSYYDGSGYVYEYYNIYVTSNNSFNRNHIDIECKGGTAEFTTIENGVETKIHGEVSVLGQRDQASVPASENITLTNPVVKFNGITMYYVYRNESGQEEYRSHIPVMPAGKDWMNQCDGLPFEYSVWIKIHYTDGPDAGTDEYRYVTLPGVIKYNDRNVNVCPGGEGEGNRGTKGFDMDVSLEELVRNITNGELSVQKNWEDNDDDFDLRPESITVKISREDADGSNKIDFMTVLVSEDTVSCASIPEGVAVSAGTTDWSLKVKELPVGYYTGENDSTFVKYKYTVDEINYSADTSGINFSMVYGDKIDYSGDLIEGTLSYTLTNALSYQEFGVKKEWGDADSMSHSSDSVTVHLSAACASGAVDEAWLKNLVAGGSLDVVLNSANGWKFVWGELPIYGKLSNGSYEPITSFTVTETSIRVNGTSYTPNSSSCPYKYTVVQDVGSSTDPDLDGVYYAKVTNSPNPNILFRKLGQISENSYAPLAGVTFKLTGVTNTSFERTAVSDSTGTVLFANVRAGEYSLQEIALPTGCTLVMDPNVYTVIVNENGDVTIGTKGMDDFEVLNRLEPVKTDLHIMKENGSGAPLTGVSFQLTKKNDSGTYVQVGTYDVDASGGKTIKDLEPGSYSLAETDCPDGFIRLTDPINFTVSEVNGKAVITLDDDSADSELWSFDEDTLTLTVVNTPGTRMPNTGGIGTQIFTIGGILLMAAAVYGLVLRKKRRA